MRNINYKTADFIKATTKLKELASDGCVSLQKGQNGIAVVTLKNFKRRNAMTAQMMLDLHEVSQDLHQWEDGKAVILVGENSHFCSGLDLSIGRNFTTQKDGSLMCIYMQTVLSSIQRLPQITISTVNGNAMGGGAEVMLASDFRHGFINTRIQFVQKTMGIVPGWGGTSRLSEIVGYRKTLDLLASGRMVTHEDGLQEGLLDNVSNVSADSEEAVKNTTKWLEEKFFISKTPAYVFQAIKMASKNVQCDQEVQNNKLNEERKVFEKVWYGPAMKEKLAGIKHGKT